MSGPTAVVIFLLSCRDFVSKPVPDLGNAVEKMKFINCLKILVNLFEFYFFF